MEIEINELSPKIEHLDNLNIILKDHQLAIIKKCVEIEENNICNFGIMNDKPGTGKTYAILGLIYHQKKNLNIIIVPHNIIIQWCNSINSFSDGLLSYKKFTEYNDILDLYNANSYFFDYDIILTTSLFYNVLATTLESKFLKVSRVFFDEIDSISNLLINEINSDFIWFVSATFNYNDLGIYKHKLDISLIPYITVKCKNSFIDNMQKLALPHIYKIICKNIYLDNIFNGLLSRDEFILLNAMDYSNLKKKFCNRIAQNEREALDLLVKDKLDIIDMENIRIDDFKKAILNLEANDERVKVLNELLNNSIQSLDDSTKKLNLIRERLKENNCCPLCYDEFDITQKKVLSQCCKNIICYNCANNWFNNMMKETCIYCNFPDTKFDNYVIIKPTNDNMCILCDKEYENINDKFYSKCCFKNSCGKCLKEWYHTLLKEKCLFCGLGDILYEDFKNEYQHEEMKLNIQSGIKYTKKTKLQFLEYYIRTKIFSNCKIIFCSNYVKIFNDMKNLLYQYNISHIELDDGNINSIYDSIHNYKYGNINVLLLNSNLFGCGLNLECTTDIVFLHKMDSDLENQIIGRAQRPGRKESLNIWYVMHENETIIKTSKTDNYFFYKNLELKIERNYDLEDCLEYTKI